MNVQTLVSDVENAALETRSLTLFAQQFNVGQELHFHRDSAIALAILATSARDVEREMPAVVASLLGIRSGCEDVSNYVEGLDVSHRIRSRGSADGRLIYQDHFTQQLSLLHAPAGNLISRALRLFVQRFLGRLPQLPFDGLKDHVMHQRGFSGS